jgi:hypothetical protein
MKSEKCLSFQIIGGDFYMMDDQFTVFKLTRNDNNRHLTIEKELVFKEILRLDFNVQPYDNTVMNEKYIISKNKICFLQNIAQERFPEGIFESDDIVKQEKGQENQVTCYRGPIRISGCNRYFNVYHTCDHQYSMKILRYPDSY